jgi:transcriptional regulator with XRE-family HTH domain
MVNPVTLKIRTKKIGVLIKDARIASGKTIEDCAAIISVDSDHMLAFEAGEASPSLPELEALSFFMDIPLVHFWGNESRSGDHQELVAASKLKRLAPLRKKIVGVLLKKARTEANISPSDLAESMGISPEQLNAYEFGEDSIPIPILEGLANALNVPIEYFWDQNGIVGHWTKQQQNLQQFTQLSLEMQDFVTKPVNVPYLEMAERLSGMPVEKLRALAEGLLDITL